MKSNKKLYASSGAIICTVALATAGYYYFQKPAIQASTDRSIETQVISEENRTPISKDFDALCCNFFSKDEQNVEVSWTDFITHLEREIGSCNLIQALRTYNKANVTTDVIVDIIWRYLDNVPCELADLFEALGKQKCIKIIGETRALELLIYSFSPPEKKKRMMWVDVIDALYHMLSYDQKYTAFRNALKKMKPKCIPSWTNPRPFIITKVILWSLKQYGKLLPPELHREVLNNKTRTTKILWSML